MLDDIHEVEDSKIVRTDNHSSFAAKTFKNIPLKDNVMKAK
jgi:hypothetical protein